MNRATSWRPVVGTMSVETPEGVFSAFVAKPRQRSAPAVVVLQEIFGINEDMRGVCRRLADEGFLAVCPDLFWRHRPGIELDPAIRADYRRAVGHYQRFDFDQGVRDIAATIEAVEGRTDCSGKVGVVGFCMGGHLAYLTATRLHPLAAVAYYGSGIDGFLHEADHLTTPLMLHLAGEDTLIPQDAQDAITRTLSGRGDVRIHIYPGLAHAFARHGGAHYSEAASTVAAGRSLGFFRAHLR